MVEGLVDLSEINQKLTKFDEAIKLIKSLKKILILKLKGFIYQKV